MEHLLEKSLDDQYAMERERKSAEDVLNRRLIWIMLPLGIAFAIAALYLDISTRIAIPVLIDNREQVGILGQRADYDVFRLNLLAYVRMVPAAVVAGVMATWLAVWAGTYYRREFIASMYVLIGVAYSAVLTARLGVLIPLNMYVLEKIGASITDSEIPQSSEISLFQGDVAAMAPLSYVVTGMERGIWAAAGLLIFALIGIRLAGGLGTAAGSVKAITFNTVLAIIVLFGLLAGPIGIHQFLFDRFVQPPSRAMLEVSTEKNLHGATS